MARGGFPGAGGMNMQQLMKQAQQMQQNMAKLQEELAQREFSASAGGGAVKATVTGAKLLKALEIDPDCVDPEDLEMLQDMILAAVNEALREGMAELGFKAYVAADRQGPFITTFLYPDQAGFDFKHMYAVLKAGGYVIYPGKLTERPSFRLGNIGEIHSDDVPKILGLFRGYLASL